LPFCHWVLKAEKPKDSAYPRHLATIGDHLKARRLDLGLTQGQLAAMLKVDETTINNWETGKRRPTIKLIPNLISLLGIAPFGQPSTLAETLKLERSITGLSQRAFAPMLGVDPSTLKNWERGLRKPSTKTWARLGPIWKNLVIVESDERSYRQYHFRLWAQPTS